MELLIQQLLNGLTVGSVYSLVALGLTLVYGILHIPNFAHGALYMMGGYVTLTMMNQAGLPYWLSIIISMIAIGLLGVLMERLVFYPLRDAPPLHDKIAAIGILLFLEAFAQFVWGADYQTMSTPYGNVINVLGLTLTMQRVLIIVSTIVIMFLLYFFLKKTFIGASIIAMSQNREGANLVGINTNKVAMMTFMISGSLAALAASLASPINLVFPGMGHLVILKAFVIIILGGMGSIPGAIIGGYILGFSESLGATYISNDYKDIIAFVILVIILTVKPTGLFAKEGQ
ncbi:branched-chain amino acid ABC transporter permease [Geobacillus sp. NFOSA3]|uniref:branched-chain amino acid ABC transporter permease n=1 Tax=Parageobacillus toebii TaxID=153151 RepID=UPI0009C0B11A|nr:branched-chain amino acid ABC transporter permease [Parageobacillus toebii]MED4971398.1 branched-chain amino acid ABC transporter permease [Parageobacillus toebii]NNU93664.1 branched-chain amino acid ABC transporter permease [Geobacillus sp. NFOSA3]OQO98959.1 branched-chain amino acid ABC transporter permease [Geobacillus sp. 44C]QNU34520.1 branched-chain amino acid ABC transporter permease [Geobacillus sp. 44C]